LRIADDRVQLQSVHSTAAPTDNSFLQAVDATAATLVCCELQAVARPPHFVRRVV
jgi:hypothetical protein